MATPKRRSAATMMLVQTRSSPRAAMQSRTGPRGTSHEIGDDVRIEQIRGLRHGGEQLEIDRLRHRVVDVREIFVDGLEGRQHREQFWRRHRFDDEAVAFVVDQRFLTGPLEVSRDANGLIATIGKDGGAA